MVNAKVSCINETRWKVIKHFSCSTQLRLKFILIVGILTLAGQTTQIGNSSLKFLSILFISVFMIQVKLRSFKSSEHVNEKRDEQLKDIPYSAKLTMKNIL